MAHFFSAGINSWRIELDRAAIQRVRDYIGIDLDEFRRRKTPLTPETDRGTFIAVIWAICEPQAVAREIDRELFTKILLASNGIALHRATAALLREVVNLLPNTKRLKVPGAMPGEIDF